MWPSNWTLGHLSQKLKASIHPKNFYMDVHSSFIHKRQKLELIRMYFNWWTITWMVMPWTRYHGLQQQYKGMNYPHHGYAMGPSPGNCSQWKTPSAKVTYCVIPFAWYRWNDKTPEMEGRPMVVRVRREEPGYVLQGALLTSVVNAWMHTHTSPGDKMVWDFMHTHTHMNTNKTVEI